MVRAQGSVTIPYSRILLARAPHSRKKLCSRPRRRLPGLNTSWPVQKFPVESTGSGAWPLERKWYVLRESAAPASGPATGFLLRTLVPVSSSVAHGLDVRVLFGRNGRHKGIKRLKPVALPEVERLKCAVHQGAHPAKFVAQQLLDGRRVVGGRIGRFWQVNS